MKNKILVSVVILHYNRPKDLLFCLNKTIAYFKRNFAKKEYEIIVVDNASTVKVPKLPNEIIFIQRKINNGVAGTNDGFKKAKGKYILQLDDDSYPISGLKQAIRYMNINDNCGILALNVINEMDTKLNDHELLTVYIACGGLIRNIVCKKLIGFPSWIFIYFNEYEYSFRVYDIGYTTEYFKNCNVKHLKSGTNRTNERLSYYYSRNSLMTYLGYFSFPFSYILFFRNFIQIPFLICKLNISQIRISLLGYKDGFFLLNRVSYRLKVRTQLKVTQIILASTFKEIAQKLISH